MNFSASVYKSPGGRSWWEAIKGVWHDDFTKTMDSLIASDEILAVTDLLPWFDADDA